MEIQCSRCGATMSFEYSAGHVIGAAHAGWNSYGSALYCPSCSATWYERNSPDRPLSCIENTVNVIDGIRSRQVRYEGAVDRNAEFEFMSSYAANNCFDDDICRYCLRILWTAYCLHHGLDVDTAEYDNDILKLWHSVSEVEGETADWSDYDSFDNFMCSYLV